CSHGPLVARPVTSSRSRSVEFITAWCTASATKQPGGRTLASIRSRPPASSGNRPASMRGGLRPSPGRNVLLQTGPPYPPVRSWTAKRRSEEGRDAHHDRSERRAVPHRRWYGIHRSRDRRPPGNLADPQQAVSILAAPTLLRGDRGRPARGGDLLGARSA